MLTGSVTGPSSAVGNMSDCRAIRGEFYPGPVPYFREIDHEIISTAILLPSAETKGCRQLQAKVCA